MNTRTSGKGNRLRRTLAAACLACLALQLPYSTAQGQERAWGTQLGGPVAVEQDASSPSERARSNRLRRQIVEYRGAEPAGTIIIDTAGAQLYLTLGRGKAIRYGIGVGREGFTWSGVTTVSHMAEWPDWIPPSEMIRRQPYLPRLMAGGPGNPLGARAIYLGSTLYRIHGTNNPSSIGKHISSGCIRLLNEDVIDLYARVQIGAKVIVLPAAVPMS